MGHRDPGLVAALLALALVGCEEPEPPPPHCGSRDLGLAPPPRDEPDAGLISAIDLRQVDATVRIDPTAGDLRVEAFARFTASEHGGRPVFQLRDADAQVRLDGVAVQTEQLRVSDPPRTLTLLPEALSPCSDHDLEVVSVVEPGDLLPGALPRLEFEGATAWWSSAQEDGMPDQMLELWMPSNLLFDRFALTLDVAIEGDEHGLVANGDVQEVGENRWTVAFDEKQGHGFFWALFPEARVERLQHPVGLPEGRTVNVELLRFADDEGVDLAASAAVAQAAIQTYDERLGPYLHGDRYLAWMRSGLDVSMEYDGATLSVPGALEHEIAHSWWGRGLSPVADQHGWIDEGMAFWATGADPFAPSAVPAGVRGARLLTGEDEWAGAGLGLGDYLQGALVFAGIAHQVGVEALLEELRAYAAQHAPGPISTDGLERRLYCAFEQPAVLDLFHNKVRGLEGFAEAPDADFCRAP